VIRFPTPNEDEVLTHRQYLVRHAVASGVPIWDAIDAASSLLLSRPEIDPDEERTWAQWLAANR
jgi:hypothetical protein